MSQKHRVVVTGVGVIAANGDNTETFWQNCLKDVGIAESIPAHWYDYADYKSTLWAPLPPLDFKALGFNRMEIMQRDPVSLLITAAAHQAIEHAQLKTELINKRKNTFNLPGIDALRAGVFMGTGSGGYTTLFENQAHHLLQQPHKTLAEVLTRITDTDVQATLESLMAHLAVPNRFNPFGVPMAMANAVSASVGIKFGLHGPNRTLTQACASGTLAVGHAFEAVQSGQVSFAITGGSEYISSLNGGEFRSFDIAKTLIRDCDPIATANRPFDQQRSGFLFAQGGAGCLILESLDSAEQRQAPILAEVVGYAETFDADSMLTLSPDGAQIVRMLDALLAQAQISPEQVDYINAHGTGTQPNDSIESQILQQQFPHKPLVNTTKSLIGHSFGASGAIEAAVCVLSLRDQTTHVCHNLSEPIAPLNFVRESKKEQLQYALSESFAFGGHNTALLFKRA